MDRRSSKPPIFWMILNAIGVLFLVGGVTGLVNPQVAPLLAPPTLAWTLIVVGGCMDLLAVSQIVMPHLKR